MAAAVDQIVGHIPEDDANETMNFLALCMEIGEQIPYHHASQNKLVTLIDLVLND